MMVLFSFISLFPVDLIGYFISFALKSKYDKEVIKEQLASKDERRLYYTGLISIDQGTELVSLPSDSQIAQLSPDGKYARLFSDFVFLCMLVLICFLCD
jgi:hypothetical protein